LKREFLINIFFLILINILIKPFYIFFIETRVQDTLGPNVYGLYFGIFNIAFILQIISDLGIQNYNSTSVARDPSLLKGYLKKILGVKLLLSVVYLFAGMLAAAFFGYLVDSPVIFFAVTVNLIILSFIQYLRTNIAATGHYRLDSFISVLDKLILIGILSYLLFNSDRAAEFDILSFIYAQTVAFSIVFILVLIINFKLASVFGISFDLAFSKKILKKSLPFSLVIILMSLYMRMDGFMLERLLDDSAFQAGVYAAAFRIYEAFNMIGYLFAILLLPMFASLINKKKELVGLINSSHNLILAIAISLVAGTIFFRYEIMYWLYPKNADNYYGDLLGLLMVSYFAISISYIYGTFLTSTNRLLHLNRLLFAGVLINLILNLVLIPGQGAMGAAWATIGTQFFVLLGQYYLSLHVLQFKPSFFLIGKRSLFIIIVLAVGYLLSAFDITPFWILNLIIIELVFIIIAFIFGFINLKDFTKEN